MEGRIRQLESILENAEIIARPSTVSPSSTMVTATTTPSATSSATSRSSRRRRGHQPDGATRCGAARRQGRRDRRVRGADRRAAVTVLGSSGSETTRPPTAAATNSSPRACSRRPGRRARPPGTVRVRDSAGPRRPDRRAAPRLDGDRRPQLLHVLRGARRALPGARLRPPRPRPGVRARRSRSGSRTAPTTWPRWPRPRRSTGSWPSATRWAAPSPSCCGGAIPRACAASCSCATAAALQGRRDERLALLGLLGLRRVARVDA